MKNLTDKVIFGGLYSCYPKDTGGTGRVNGNAYDQNYGYYVPIYNEETDEVWMVDTYHIQSPSKRPEDDGFTAAQIRIMQTYYKEGGSWTIKKSFADFYYNSSAALRDSNFDKFKLVADLSEYRLVKDAEADRYDDEDCLYNIRLWWEHGYPRGVTLVKKTATPKLHNDIRIAIQKIYNRLTPPRAYVGIYIDTLNMLISQAKPEEYDAAKVEEVRAKAKKLKEMESEWKEFCQQFKESK